LSLLEQLSAAGIPAEQSFSAAEYEARLAAVRARMEAAGLDTLLLTSAPNLCYLTGYETIMPTCYAVAVVPLEGDAVLHLPEEDIPCALSTGWVREPHPLGIVVVDLVDLRERVGGHLGRVRDGLPVVVADEDDSE